MKYVSGVHALNLPCGLLTCGDWHQHGIQWSSVPLYESGESLFGDYGIEQGKSMPEHEGQYNIANHIRALLDLLEQGRFSVAQGMNNDFICNKEYDFEVFKMVTLLKAASHWKQIDSFMGREYYSKWLDFKKEARI